MRTSLLALLLGIIPITASAWSAPASGCGPANEDWTVRKTSDVGQLPTPAENAQIIYLNRAGIGYYNQVKIAVDGQWKAATARNSYAVFQVPAGEHNVCAKAAKFKVSLPVKVEAGKTYFVGESTPGLLSQPYLELMSEENGRAQLHNLKLAVSSPKN